MYFKKNLISTILIHNIRNNVASIYNEYFIKFGDAIDDN
jgi:hypothetical protein